MKMQEEGYGKCRNRLPLREEEAAGVMAMRLFNRIESVRSILLSIASAGDQVNE